MADTFPASWIGFIGDCHGVSEQMTGVSIQDGVISTRLSVFGSLVLVRTAKPYLVEDFLIFLGEVDLFCFIFLIFVFDCKGFFSSRPSLKTRCNSQPAEGSN